MHSNSIENSYLEEIVLSQLQVSVYLLNGIKLSGYIIDKDDVSISLRDNKNIVTQLIYKHAISTIVPVKSNIHEVS